MFFVTFALILAIIALIHVFMTWNFGYWRKRNVPGPTPSFLTGNVPNMFSPKRHIAYDMWDIYRAFKKDYDAVGIYSARSPQLLVISPELVHRVFVTDFKHFHDNEISELVDEKSDFIIANNPFSLTGEKWKEHRAEITPGLTMGRVKTVYPVTRKVCEKISNFIREQNRMGSKDGIDCSNLSMRYTSEVVSDCVLGVSAESFTPHPTPIFSNSQKIFDQTWVFVVQLALVNLFPLLRRFYKIKFIPTKVEQFFTNLMQTAVDLRKQQIKNDPQLERADFLNYLLQLQEKKSLDTKQLTMRSMTFLLDGFETTAIVLGHALLLLARNQEAQKKLCEEIKASAHGEISFEKLHEMPYLDACLQETIRLFPPAFASNRICTLPLELTNSRGQTFSVQKGDVIVVPHYSFMHDEEYFPDPEEYKPERFTTEPDAAKKYREQGVFLGFGDGPRICLGMRFAVTQTKAALVEVIQNFNLKVNPKTRKDNKLDPTYFLSRLDGGIWLDIEPRN